MCIYTIELRGCISSTWRIHVPVTGYRDDRSYFLPSMDRQLYKLCNNACLSRASLRCKSRFMRKVKRHGVVTRGDTCRQDSTSYKESMLHFNCRNSGGMFTDKSKSVKYCAYPVRNTIRTCAAAPFPPGSRGKHTPSSYAAVV